MQKRRVVIVSPALADANNGNWQTARRWQRLLAPHQVRIVRQWPGNDPAAHAQALPEMSATPFASGQEAAVAGLLQSLGGAAFVLDRTAKQLIESGKFAAVTDVEPISQPAYAVMHQRHRTQRLHKRLTKTVLKVFGGR